MDETLPVLLVVRCCIIDDGNLLLIKRSEDDRYEPGKWEFPGGKVEIYEDLNQALISEVEEEIGLHIRPDTDFMFTESKVLKGELYPGHTYVGLCGITRMNVDSIALSNEHKDYAWWPPSVVERKQGNLTPETAKAFRAMRETGRITSE